MNSEWQRIDGKLIKRRKSRLDKDRPLTELLGGSFK